MRNSICHVYWIHHRNHNNLFTQGYIGISKDPDTRFKCHQYTNNQHLSRALKKYTDDIELDVLLIGVEEYCREVERKLRPIKNIGWNICEGGGMPPDCTGRKRTKEEIQNYTESRKRNNKPSPLLGRKFPERGVNISKAKKGKKFSKEHREKLSVAAFNRKKKEIKSNSNGNIEHVEHPDL